jgi:hypothetical protein
VPSPVEYQPFTFISTQSPLARGGSLAIISEVNDR